MLLQLPFFQLFRATKLLILWRRFTRRSNFERNILKLRTNGLFAQEVFLSKMMEANVIVGKYEQLQMFAIRERQIYSYGSHSSLLRRQERTEEVLQEKVTAISKEAIVFVNSLHEAVDQEIACINRGLERRIESVLSFRFMRGSEHYSTQLRNQKYFQSRQNDIQRIKSLKPAFFRYMMIRLYTVLLETLLKNEQKLAGAVLHEKSAAAFQIVILIGQGNTIELEPTYNQLLDTITEILDNTRQKIYHNRYFSELLENMQKAHEKLRAISSSAFINYVSRLTTKLSQGEQDVVAKMIAKLHKDYDVVIKETYKYNKFLEVTAFHEQFNQDMASYDFDLPDTGVLINWLATLGKFGKQIEGISTNNIQCGETMVIYAEGMKGHLESLVEKMVDRLRDKAIDAVDRALGDFKYDLMYKAQSIDSVPYSVQEYIEQIKSIESFHEKRLQFDQEFRKFESAIMIMRDHRIHPTPSILRLLSQIKLLMDSLPSKLESSIERIIKERAEIHEKIKESYQELIGNIEDFKIRYINEYFRDQTRIEHPESTLAELSNRSENIETKVRRLVDVYLGFDYYENVNRILEKKVISEGKETELRALLRNEVQAEGAYDKEELSTLMTGVDKIHKEAKRLWKMLSYWSRREKGFQATQFRALDIERVFHCATKLRNYFNDPVFDPDDEDFGSHAKWIKRVMLDHIAKLTEALNKLAFLQNETIKERHWHEILTALDLPSKNFTMAQVLETDYQNHFEALQKMITSGESEVKYEEALKEIFEGWDSECIKFQRYKRSFIVDISDTEFLRIKLEDYKTVIQQLALRKSGSGYLQAKVDSFIQNYDKIQNLLELLLNCHERYMRLELLEEELVEKRNSKMLEAICDSYGEAEISKIGLVFEQFQASLTELQAGDCKLRSILHWKSLDAYCDTLVELAEQFGGMSVKMSIVLTQKRENFPRYYLLDDRQLVSFINSIQIGENYSQLLSEVFPGAYKFHTSYDQQESSHIQLSRSIDLQKSAPHAEVTQKEKLLNYLKELKNRSISDVAQVSQNYSNDSTGKTSDKHEALKFSHLQAITEISKTMTQTYEDHPHLRGLPDFIEELREKPYHELKMMAQTAQAFSLSEVKILGMIDRHNEYLRFKKPVTSQGKGLETILKKVEVEMQGSVLHWISQSISTFPHYNLDEWILDYPVQVIISSIHLIVTHEIYEMIKLLERGRSPSKQADQDSHDLSSSIYNTYDSGSVKRSDLMVSQSGSPSRKDQRQNTTDFLEQERQCEEMEQILAKPLVTVQVLEDPLDMVDLFGYNMDQKYLCSGKDEMHNMLQQKSFRGLYLRLEFWINLLMKNFRRDKNSDDSALYGINYQLKCEKVISFIVYLKDIVLDIYENSNVAVSEFDWHKHVRLSFDTEGKGCIVECGGWSGSQGHEYVGSMARHLITPITEKYFVFISGALREKSAIGFKTVDNEESSGHVIEEFATICSVAFKNFLVPSGVCLNLLTSLINSAANANLWLNLEHLHNLPYTSLRWLNKEIQLVQQRVILADLNHQVELSRSVKLTTTQGTQNTQMEDYHYRTDDDKEITRKRKRVAYGVFASYNPQMVDQAEWTSSLNSSFRVTSLMSPNMQELLSKTLFVMGFRSYLILTTMTMDLLLRFRSRVETIEKDRRSFVTSNDQQEYSLPIEVKITFRELEEVMGKAALILTSDSSVNPNTELLNARARSADVNSIEAFNTEEDLIPSERAAVVKSLYLFLWDK